MVIVNCFEGELYTDDECFFFFVSLKFYL